MQRPPHWNYFCMLLDDVIEFSENRYLQITHAHPEMMADFMDEFEAAIVYPDFIFLKGQKYKLIKKIFVNECPRWIVIAVHYDNVHERLWIANAYTSAVPIEGEVIYG